MAVMLEDGQPISDIGFAYLSELLDVDISSIQDGDLLKYNGTTHKIEKYTPPFVISENQSGGYDVTYPS